MLRVESIMIGEAIAIASVVRSSVFSLCKKGGVRARVYYLALCESVWYDTVCLECFAVS